MTVGGTQLVDCLAAYSEHFRAVTETMEEWLFLSAEIFTLALSM